MIGIWSWKDPKEDNNGIGFRYCVGDVTGYLTNSRIWRASKLRYIDAPLFSYESINVGGWRIDDSFISYYVDFSYNCSFKYSFLDEDTIKLIDEIGETRIYERISKIPYNQTQIMLKGKWECPYDAGYGETKITSITCDDFNQCIGETGLNRYLISSFLYEPVFLLPNSNGLNISTLFSYDLYIKAYAINQFNMDEFQADNYYQHEDRCRTTWCMEYTFNDDKFDEFTRSSEYIPEEINSDRYPQFYLSCKKIGD